MGEVIYMVKTKYKKRREERERVHTQHVNEEVEEETIHNQKLKIVHIIPAVVAVLGVVLFTLTANGKIDVLYGGMGLAVAILCIFIEIIVLNRGGGK